nr:acyltransferase [Bifidobacterium adolescentis]
MATKRNSSIELLRIISMLMIILHHFVYANMDSFLTQKSFLQSFFLYVCFSMGKIGVGIFFIISAWYLVDKKVTPHYAMKKAWILEKEILFWSLLLLGASVVMTKKNLVTVNMHSLILKSIFPLVKGLWWYASSYVLFLLLLPPLRIGLQALNQSIHKYLSVLVIGVWGIVALFPRLGSINTANGAFGMALCLVLIAYYKWYMKPISSRSLVCTLSGCIAAVIAWWACIKLVGAELHISSAYMVYLTQGWPSLFPCIISFCIFILFSRLHFSNCLVNKIASCTFGIYLIHTYPLVNDLIWKSNIVPVRMSSNPFFIMVYALLIFAICALLEFARQSLFSFIFGKNDGKTFDTLIDKMARLQQ